MGHNPFKLFSGSFVCVGGGSGGSKRRHSSASSATELTGNE